DDDQLVGQRLFQQLVARAVAEEIADDGGDAHDGPEDELYVGQLDAMQLGTGFVGDDPVGGAHEARQHPYDQQVGVDGLGDVEGHDVQQRVGPQVLGGRQQPEDELQPEENQG